MPSPLSVVTPHFLIRQLVVPKTLLVPFCSATQSSIEPELSVIPPLLVVNALPIALQQ